MRAQTSGHHGLRLFDYDRRLFLREVSAVLLRWTDRLIAAILLVCALGALRARLAERPWKVAVAIAVLSGLAVGLTIARAIVARLAFHGSDGLLAADALRSATRWRYTLAWHAIGLALLSLVLLVARADLLIASIPAYLVGALLGHASAGLALAPRAAHRRRAGSAVRSWLLRLSAGLAGAATLIALLAAFHAVKPIELDVVAGVAAGVLVVLLTTVDAAVVRFLTAVGFGCGRIVLRRSLPVLLFAAVAVPPCLFAFDAAVAGIVLAVASAGLVVLALRILAYRLHPPRVAGVMVSILIGVGLLFAAAMPVLLPFFVVVAAWHLHRRAAAKTWLLT